MDFLSAIVGPVVESLLLPVKKHLGYLFSSTKHVRNMSTRMRQLDGTSDDVKKHMETNKINNLEIPTRVPDWVEEVNKIKEDAERISSNVSGCFNLKMRYRVGRKAFKTTHEIEALIRENVETIWHDAQKPLGKVSFKMASASNNDAQNYFKSREKIFKEALGLLQQDQKVQVIALCGMGGVGKTTMMEQLKKTVEDKKMFDWVLKEVIGQKINIFSIQQTMAEYLGHPLTETSKTARADRLRIAFRKMSQESKKKVLIVLDDVWEKVELGDIGLSPLPNGFKLLLTSRNEKVCTQIAIEANADLRVVRVKLMEELEANNFFCEISKVSNPELKDIGVEIVRRCGFLPLAIKLIATNLKSQEKSVWRDTLRRLKEIDLDENVQRIIEISYTFIAEEDAKAVFLLCGLFPDDSNIPIEDLTRYAWGLKLLKKVCTLGDARDRTKACVLNLKSANLLLDSDHSECVKMHDLVLAFVVTEVSKVDHPWIINHGEFSNLSRAEMIRESCKAISLTCMGMCEFPRDFNYPNVSLLRLANGDESIKSLTFPVDFYEKMEKLQVMACEKLQYPLLPRSLQCSTKLQTLCLHQCSLMSDCSPIGEYLLNLEVLSFAHSRISYLPSAIGNLVKLKLLDLTGCINLYVDEGVLKNLVKLEELYMTVAGEKGVRFTDINYKELEERSKNLSALEIEFFETDPKTKNMSYNKLERFKISMGRFLETNNGKDVHSSENTLMFVTNKDELLESGMNELFSKTEVLHLKVGGMNNLEEVLPKSVPQHSFYNLRVLCVSGCADLRYLFTVPVASRLVNLEDLKISECDVMEALVYSENGKEGAIRFEELKHLSLYDLPMLVVLSNTNDVIDLPQLVELELRGLPNFTSVYPEYKSATSIMSSSSSSSAVKPFFNKKVMIPKLAILKIYGMDSLKNIWPCGTEVDACLLREIKVENCQNLVNMFPSNPMPLLHHLETSDVGSCGSIEVLVNIDAGYRDNDEEVLTKSVPRHSLYNLRDLCVSRCDNLRYLFTVPLASGLVKLEDLKIGKCPVLETLVCSESGEKGDIRFQELKDLYLYDLPMLVGFSNTNDVIDLPQLVKLQLEDLPNITSIYPEFKSATSVMSCSSFGVKPFFNKEVMIPKLEILRIVWMNALKNIWPCGSEVDACLLREIKVENCQNLVNMFPSNPMPLLHHLETSDVGSCGSIEVLVNIDAGYRDNDEEVLTKSVPRHSLYNLRDLCVSRCDNLRYLFTVPLASWLVKLEDLKIGKCPVLETLVCSENGEKGDIRFQELKDLYLYDLPMLVGFSNTNDVIDLPQLVKLQLEDLPNITSIYPEFKSATSVMSCSSFGVKPFFNKEVMIPKLEILQIVWMNALKNIWPCGSDAEVDACLLRQISVGACHNLEYMFTSNRMPLLHHLETIDVKYCDNLEEVLLKCVSGHSFYNLRVLHVSTCYDLRYLFTVPVVSGLVNLERLTIRNCPVMEALVYNENGEEGAIRFQKLKYLSLDELPILAGFSNTNDVINLPQLVELELRRLPIFTSIYPEYKSATSIMSSSSSAVKPFFNKKVLIPRLEILQIHRMEALKNIWPCGSSEEVDACFLREIRVRACGKLVNMFPSNPMPLLHHFETIDVGFCDSLEVLFDIDVGCLCEIKEGGSKLRSIIVFSSRELREVWRVNGIINPDLIIRGFQAVERIEINGCKSFRNIITPTTARLDLGALKDIKTYGSDYPIDSNHYKESEEENNELVKSNQETSYDCENPKEAILRVTSAPRKRYPADIKSFSHELNSEGVRPFPIWMPRGLSNLEWVLVTVRAKFEKAKEEVDFDLHIFAADLLGILEKNSESQPEWQETLEDLLILAQRCAMTSPAEFWLHCEDIVQELDDRRQELPMGILKQVHTRMLIILTRCTRFVQFYKESHWRKMDLKSFHKLSALI